MARPPPSVRRSDCPLNIALEVLGDRWSLLIVRDLLFKGRCTYRDFHEAGERIATNILADRLRRLERAGIVVKRRARDDARRFRYALTAKGVDLAPVLVEMIVWGARHYATAAPPSEIDRMTRRRTQFLAGVRRRFGADYSQSID